MPLDRRERTTTYDPLAHDVVILQRFLEIVYVLYIPYILISGEMNFRVERERELWINTLYSS